MKWWKRARTWSLSCTRSLIIAAFCPSTRLARLIGAAPGFQLVVSYNPGYQRMLKDMKPSTRQRFVALDFDFPPPEREIDIVAHESGVERAMAHTLVTLAGRIRSLRDRGLAEVPSTRLLVATARLIASGIPCAQRVLRGPGRADFRRSLVARRDAGPGRCDPGIARPHG